jgi:hypothetical protein
MSEKSLPEAGKPYRTGYGFAMWQPQLTTLNVYAHRGHVEIEVGAPGVETLCFALTPTQRDELVALLMAAAPANTGECATQTVAEQGV